jgi:hypothetical protein
MTKKKAKARKKALKYVGPGWVRGVPARDLNVEERARFEELAGTDLATVISPNTKQPLYEEIEELSTSGDEPEVPPPDDTNKEDE